MKPNKSSTYIPSTLFFHFRFNKMEMVIKSVENEKGLRATGAHSPNLLF
jgi:hypothetical protein